MESFSITVDKDREDLQKMTFQYAGLDIPTYWKGFHLEGLKGSQNLLLGHLSIIKHAKYNDIPEIIIYEDDAYPCIDCAEKLKEALKNAPDDTTMLLLGWFHNSAKRTNEFNQITTANTIYGSHAYYLRYPAYDEILTSVTSVNTTSDAFYRKVKSGCYSLKNPLFIQYCIESSMNKHEGYIYGNIREKMTIPPEGFTKVEDMMKCQTTS